MKWSEVRRMAERKGWILVRFGRKHDVYQKGGDILLIERHSSAELRGDVRHKILKQLGLK
jgi:predicted RNA binding protein YcfA (HicA-like mRNA interferase family)